MKNRKYIIIGIILLLITLGCSSNTKAPEEKTEELILDTYQLTVTL